MNRHFRHQKIFDGKLVNFFHIYCVTLEFVHIFIATLIDQVHIFVLPVENLCVLLESNMNRQTVPIPNFSLDDPCILQCSVECVKHINGKIT